MGRTLIETHASALSEGMFGIQSLLNKATGKSALFRGDTRKKFEQALGLHIGNPERDETWRIAYVHLILDRFALGVHSPKAGANHGFRNRPAAYFADHCLPIADYSALSVERASYMAPGSLAHFKMELPPVFSDDRYTLFDAPEFGGFLLRIHAMAAQFPVNNEIGMQLLSIVHILNDLPEKNIWVKAKAQVMACRRFCTAIASNHDEALSFLSGDPEMLALAHLSGALAQPDHEF